MLRMPMRMLLLGTRCIPKYKLAHVFEYMNYNRAGGTIVRLELIWLSSVGRLL